MKKTPKLFKPGVLLLIIMLGTSSAAYASSPIIKLGRGAANITTGWVEFFSVTGNRFKKRSNIADALGAIPEGLVTALKRTFTGVYEVITFPFPGSNNYEPVLMPEFVSIRESNIENIREKR